jgi:hypothetical protein
MSNGNDDFTIFLRKWSEENVGDLGDRTDPSDHRYYYGRCAERLQEDATANGHGIQISRLAREYKGGLREFIEGVYRRRYGGGY